MTDRIPEAWTDWREVKPREVSGQQSPWTPQTSDRSMGILYLDPWSALIERWHDQLGWMAPWLLELLLEELLPVYAAHQESMGTIAELTSQLQSEERRRQDQADSGEQLRARQAAEMRLEIEDREKIAGELRDEVEKLKRTVAGLEEDVADRASRLNLAQLDRNDLLRAAIRRASLPDAASDTQIRRFLNSLDGDERSAVRRAVDSGALEGLADNLALGFADVFLGLELEAEEEVAEEPAEDGE